MTLQWRQSRLGTVEEEEELGHAHEGNELYEDTGAYL